MERYFKFNNINTYYDWNLILTAKNVTPPEPKTNYIELDGMNGTLDLTEALSGEVTYNDRIITASFWTNEGTRQEREKLYHTITKTLHGKKIDIIEPDDPDHYFKGRGVIKSWTNNLVYAELTIEFTCEPWRYSVEQIKRLVEVDGETYISIFNDGVKTVVPTVTTDGIGEIYIDNFWYTVAYSSYKFLGLKLYQGNNIVRVRGRAKFTFTYEEASL